MKRTGVTLIALALSACAASSSAVSTSPDCTSPRGAFGDHGGETSPYATAEDAVREGWAATYLQGGKLMQAGDGSIIIEQLDGRTIAAFTVEEVSDGGWRVGRVAWCPADG